MKLKSLSGFKFETLEKEKMSKVFGGYAAPVGSTGSGTHTRGVGTPAEQTVNYSSDTTSTDECGNVTGTTYHVTGGPNDPARPAEA